MLSFRPKLGTERSKEWRCCFSLHVRTGTILLGSWHLLLHLIALGFVVVLMNDPNLANNLDNDSTPITDLSDIGSAMPTPLSNVEPRPSHYPQSGPHYPRDHSPIYHDVDVGAMVTVCTLAITLMLIYGAARGRPAHLLPFFCLQIFDFAITVLTTVGYLYYLPSIRRVVAEAPRVPWRDSMLALPGPVLGLVVLGTFLVAILFKGYSISIVWRCYKYLSMRTHVLHCISPFVITRRNSATAAAPQTVPAPDYSSMLPDYEEAVKQTPPPSYHVATLMAADGAVATPPAPAAEQIQTPANTVVILPREGEQARV